MAEVVAAIDCGSNSTRALVVNDEGRALARELRITRLAQGVDATGSLRPEAMERTFAALSEYRERCDELGATRGLLVATSAARDATNGSVFLARARAISGFEARTLRGNQEAALSYRGARMGLEEVAQPTMIVDVGGGSTELAVELDGELASCSMQLGCVRVCERVLGRGVVTPERDAAARDMIEGELERAFQAVPAFNRVVGQVRLVGLAGTVATLAQLDAELAIYDRDVVHHRVLARGTVQHWRDLLASETPEQRLRHLGMVVGREDVLPAGLYVLDAVMGRLAVDRLLTSENDILDGITSTLLDPRCGGVDHL